MLSELEKFKVQAILALDYKKGNDRKIFDSNAKLDASDSIAKLDASDSDIDEAFKPMHQSTMTKMKNLF